MNLSIVLRGTRLAEYNSSKVKVSPVSDINGRTKTQNASCFASNVRLIPTRTLGLITNCSTSAASNGAGNANESRTTDSSMTANEFLFSSEYEYDNSLHSADLNIQFASPLPRASNRISVAVREVGESGFCRPMNWAYKAFNSKSESSDFCLFDSRSLTDTSNIVLIDLILRIVISLHPDRSSVNNKMTTILLGSRTVHVKFTVSPLLTSHLLKNQCCHTLSKRINGDSNHLLQSPS